MFEASTLPPLCGDRGCRSLRWGRPDLEATLGTIFVLAANTIMRPVVNRMNRRPIDTAALEATNTIYVIAVKEKQKEALQLLEQALEEANHPIGDPVIHSFGENEVEIHATLTATSVDADELDHVTRRLPEHDSVVRAFWSPSTAE
jgi:putative Mg2+ transporter-C (MgtC) family protein